MAELTPMLCVSDGPAAIEWYRTAMGAEVSYDPITMPDGRLGHVELAVDGAGWMMSGEFPDHHVQGPDPTRGTAVTLHLAVDDVDALARRMSEAGASLDRGPADDEQAGRVAVLRDPFGHRWFLNGPLRDG
ncbi:VOC family protein [Nocardioides sp.]|uniref:VOC family protein n=1 Tax=Nocardioides sp. TaxID=35761 RepID=UPI001A1A5C26|nr:VOC family protein [Nocardioides sp.]MBJ7357474.1 VOC family protein [Nocardioides sp.]